jgi:hypothetical protein
MCGDCNDDAIAFQRSRTEGVRIDAVAQLRWKTKEGRVDLVLLCAVWVTISMMRVIEGIDKLTQRRTSPRRKCALRG